jgi:hypothetical protein
MLLEKIDGRGMAAARKHSPPSFTYSTCLSGRKALCSISRQAMDEVGLRGIRSKKSRIVEYSMFSESFTVSHNYTLISMASSSSS